MYPGTTRPWCIGASASRAAALPIRMRGASGPRSGSFCHWYCHRHRYCHRAAEKAVHARCGRALGDGHDMGLGREWRRAGVAQIVEAQPGEAGVAVGAAGGGPEASWAAVNVPARAGLGQGDGAGQGLCASRMPAVRNHRGCYAGDRGILERVTDERAGMNTRASRDELVGQLVRIGEKLMTGEDEAAVDAYFAPEFRFHGPDGTEQDYTGLKAYFTALRDAFDDLTITRGIIVAEGHHIACQTSIAGTFARPFTHSPVGTLPPNGEQVVFALSNIFRYDDEDRLIEEWVQTDNRGVLRQLGAQGR